MNKSLAFFIFFLSSTAFANGLISGPHNLFVFIGEQIDISELKDACPEGSICMDAGYRARYKVIKTVYGKYTGGETIEFVAYDHYGFPGFANFKKAMLFVSDSNKGLYHQKYQFFEVHKTIDDDWAYCGDPYKEEDPAINKAIQPLVFSPELAYDISNFSLPYIAREFPLPAYEVVGDKAVCRLGVKANDLFELKKQTVLKARGLFK